MKTSASTLILTFLLLTLGADAFAQFGGGMGGRRSRSGDMGSAPRQLEGSSISRTQQVADKLYDLRLRLMVTPEQSPAWEDFYNKVMSWSAEAYRPRTSASDQPAISALQQRVGEAQNRFAAMEAVYDAAKRLLGTLSPEQQKVADQYLSQAIP